jgi:hypothetical protein
MANADDTTNTGQFAFDVALSFAEEDRDFVNRVARHLKRKKIKTFYDKDALIDTWGENMYTHLDNIYRNTARFCVIFISKHYKEKRWTQHERDSAQARAFFSSNEPYLLPFRFDNTDIEGIRDTIGYLSINDFDEQRLADAIAAKLQKADHNAASQAFHTGKNIGLSPLKKAIRLLRLRLKAILLFSVTAIGLTVILYNSATYEQQEKAGIQPLYTANDNLVRGSRCRDGSFSTSRGSGSCSHHGGVAYLDSMPYDAFIKQSKQKSK